MRSLCFCVFTLFPSWNKEGRNRVRRAEKIQQRSWSSDHWQTTEDRRRATRRSYHQSSTYQTQRRLRLGHTHTHSPVRFSSSSFSCSFDCIMYTVVLYYAHRSCGWTLAFFPPLKKKPPAFEQNCGTINRRRCRTIYYTDCKEYIYGKKKDFVGKSIFVWSCAASKYIDTLYDDSHHF